MKEVECNIATCDDCAVRWSCSLEADGPPFVPCAKHDTLDFLRRVMNAIHAGGNIWYDAGRKAGYSLIAKIASEMRATGRV